MNAHPRLANPARSLAVIACLAALIGAVPRQALAQPSQVLLNAACHGVEFLGPGGLETPQDTHGANITTLPELLTGASAGAGITLSTGGSHTANVSGSIGVLRSYSSTYEVYGTDSLGHPVAQGYITGNSHTYFAENITLLHHSLPDGTPVTCTVNFVIRGTHSVPDSGDSGGYAAYAVGSFTISDQFNFVSSPYWNSQGRPNSSTTLHVSFDTEIGRTIVVTAFLDTSTYVSTSALTGRTAVADYSTGTGGGFLTITTSVPGTSVVGFSGYDFAPSCPQDLNGDHAITTVDLAQLLSHFGQSVPIGTLGDINADGVVNTVDLASLLSKFGTSCP